MSGKEKQYYEIRKGHLWIVIGIMLSIIVITYLGQDLFEIWQRKQGREDSLETSKWKYEKNKRLRCV